MGSSQFAGCCKLPHRATGAGFNKETALGCAASAANQMKNVAAIFNGCGTPIGRCMASSKSGSRCTERACPLPAAQCNA